MPQIAEIALYNLETSSDGPVSFVSSTVLLKSIKIWADSRNVSLINVIIGGSSAVLPFHLNDTNPSYGQSVLAFDGEVVNISTISCESVGGGSGDLVYLSGIIV